MSCTDDEFDVSNMKVVMTCIPIIASFYIHIFEHVDPGPAHGKFLAETSLRPE